MACRPGASLAFTASTTPAAISSWTAKTSAASRSYRSDQSWKAARHVGQLRGDTKPAARRSHAAFEEMAHGEDARDLRHGLALGAGAEGRGARRHADPADTHERVHDFLGHALAQILLILAGAHVRERQHRDRNRRLSESTERCGSGPTTSSPALRSPSSTWSTSCGASHFPRSSRTGQAGPASWAGSARRATRADSASPSWPWAAARTASFHIPSGTLAFTTSSTAPR